MTPQFPTYIDNTMRKNLVKCQKSAYYRFELGLQSKSAKKVDLVAGGAYAKGMETLRRAYYVQGESAAKSAELAVAAIYDAYGPFPCPKDSNKSAERMAGALLSYLERHPLETEELVPLTYPNGEVGIEIGFAFEIGLDNPVTKQPLFYCGKMDMLAVDTVNGGVWVVDEKTSSSMGDKWANQWPLDSQMSGYCWAADRILAEHGIHHELKGAIINGVAIKKYDYDHGRFKAYREKWEIERWFEQLKIDISAWSKAHIEGSHSYNLDHSCAYYLNPCEYAPLCKAKNPERLIEGQYVVEFWKPHSKS